MLLGRHAASIRGRSDEPLVDRRPDGVCVYGESRGARPPGRSNHWPLSCRRGNLVFASRVRLAGCKKCTGRVKPCGAKKPVWGYNWIMEKTCIASVAVFLGVITYYLAYATGRSGSTCVILGVLVGAYGAWLGEQLFTKIHH